MMLVQARCGRGARTLAVFGMTSALLVAVGCGESGAGTPEPAAEVAEASTEPAAPRAVARIVEPANGAEVPAGDVRVVLAADNITIVPSGDTTPNSGHHHLLLNVQTPPEGEPIPSDVTGFVHLGQAQTEYTFTGLEPGEYTLVAVIGDFAHRVIDQDSDTVRFRVLPAAP